MLTLDMLAAIGDRAPNDNMRSILAGLEVRGRKAGLLQPHRQAHYLAQLGHESMGFHHDREIWGPTPAQERYDTRTDLGNTPERDGDGKRFMGRTMMMMTGAYNYGLFTGWTRSFAPEAPDFTEEPEAVNSDPWEGLVPIWYWQEGNPTGESLNRYADANNIELVTRRINGGLNGFADRLRYYDRAALVLLGEEPGDIRGFQETAAITVDGISGPQTRGALHAALRAIEAPAQAPVASAEPAGRETALEAAARGAMDLLGGALAPA